MGEKVNKYKVYGLNIDSEFEIPQLMNRKDDLEGETVKIIYGNIDENIKSKFESKYFHERRDSIYLNIKNVAYYHILNGNSIIVEKYKDAGDDRVNSFLLSWAFGALFIQRGLVAIHGSAVANENGAIILSGKKEAGKSTLAQGFKLKGYKYLSDDLSTINIDENDNITINPSYPQGKLSLESITGLGYDGEEFKLIGNNSSRVRYFIPNKDSFENKECKLILCCEITVGDNDKVEVEEIREKEALDILLDNIYKFSLEKKFGIRKEYYDKCLKISTKIRFLKVIRPKDKFTVDEQIKAIENFIKNKK